MLRRILLAVCALCTPASAGDGSNWTGFHAGINAGVAGGQYSYPLSGALTASPGNILLNGKIDMDATGFLGGGQAGYDYLLAGGWLIGFEADADATSALSKLRAGGPFDTTGTFDLSGRSNLDFLGTARLRAGYVLPQNALVYGTAGLAYGGVSTKFDLHLQKGIDTLNVNIDRFAVDVGWTAGVGVEYPIGDGLSLRAEYLYVDLGSYTVLEGQLLSPAVSGSGGIKTETSAHVGRIALNYSL